MENVNELKENPLGYEKVGKLIRKFAVPSILAMLISSLYNIVDQIFIGQGVGPLGNAATNVSFPLTSISLAISLLIGIGAASNCSIMLGRNEKKEAGQILANAIWMMSILGIIFAVVAELTLPSLLMAFGSTESIYPYAFGYARIILIGMPFLIMNNALSNLIRADGSPRYSMVSMMVGAIINTILDPIFIFVLKMGVEGAALATIISQIISCLISIAYIPRFKRFRITKENYKINFRMWYLISSLGMSNSINQIAFTIVQIVMNNSLKFYGAQSIYGPDIPLAAFGVCMKVNALFIAFFVGMNQGTQPILGFNYGAMKYDRVMETFKKGILIDVLAGVIGLILFESCPGLIVKMFGTGSDPLYFEFAEKTLRIFLSMIVCIGASFLCNNLFSSIGQPGKGILLSLSRQFIFLIPLLLLLPLAMGIDGILIAGPISDFLALALALVFVVLQFKKMKKNIEN